MCSPQHIPKKTVPKDIVLTYFHGDAVKWHAMLCHFVSASKLWKRFAPLVMMFSRKSSPLQHATDATAMAHPCVSFCAHPSAIRDPAMTYFLMSQTVPNTKLQYNFLHCPPFVLCDECINFLLIAFCEGNFQSNTVISLTVFDCDLPHSQTL
jgi:hypothetical protein